MSRIWLGVLCGLIYGALDVALMVPMQFTDKRAAITGAFINRFSIGFVTVRSNCRGRVGEPASSSECCLAWLMR